MPNWKKVIISGSDAALNSVGIGTTSPSQALHVIGSAKVSNKLFLGGNADVIDPSSNSGAMTIGSNTPIRFTNASTTEYVRITTSGDVGIGTTSPSEKLTVEGNISGSGTGSFESVAIPGTTTDYYIGGSGGGAATNELRIGSKTTTNNIALELHHSLNPVSLGIEYDSGGGLAFIESVHSSYDTNTHMLFKPGGVETWRIGSHGSNASNKFQIQPAAAANDFIIADNSGNAILYSDTSTQRIGIGTTTPSEKLTVEGNISGSGDINIVGDVTASAFVGDGSALTGVTAEWDGSHNGDAEITGSLIVSGSGVGLTVTGNTTLEGDNRHIYFGGSNTFIGESSNSNKLQLRGGGSSTAHTVFIDNTGQLGLGTLTPVEKLDISAGNIRLDDNQRITWSTNDSNIGRVRITGNESSDFLTFVTDNSERIRIDSSGNVGIGTTTPAEKLTVEGNISGSGDVNIVGDVTASAFVGDGSALTNITAEWDGSHNGDAEITGSLTISGSSADLTVTGNVGIGTTSPTGRNGFVGQKVFELYNASSYASLNVTGNGSTFGTLGAQTSGVDLRSSGPLRLATNGNSTRMTLDSSGNVGIGTTSPGAKLNVEDANGSDTAGSGVFKISAASNADHQFGFRLDSSAKNLHIDTSYGGTDYTAAYITRNNRHFGIGVLPADARLQVKGAGSTSSTTALLVQNSSGTNLFEIEDGGNVGIGTTSPSTKLEVSGNGTVLSAVGSGNAGISILSNGTNDLSYIYFADTADSDVGGLIYDHSTNGFTVRTGGNNRHFIGSDVGIGTTTPAEKLTVEGNISGSGNLNVDGNFTMAGGTLDTAGGLIDTNGGDIDTNGGNINIGTGGLVGTIPGSTVNVDTITATIKNFVIDHPSEEKTGYKLRHSSLEGPEIGVYFRGKSTGSIIHLPDYWEDLVDRDSITVNLTSFGSPCQHYIEGIKDNQVVVGCACGTPNYHFTVYGERKDVDRLVVEYKEETYL